MATGTIHDEARQRQEEIRSRLQSVDNRARPAFEQAKDYYTSEEAAQFLKPKKKVSLAKTIVKNESFVWVSLTFTLGKA